MINSKLILKQEDFSYPEKTTDEIFRNIKNGFLEITIKDQGTGIK
jgi:hypothetical protein